MPPGQIDAGLAPDLDPASDPQSIGDAGIASRRQFDIAAPFDPRPHIIAERQPGDFLGPCPRRLVIAIGETKPCAPFRQMVPMMPPRTFQLFVARVRELVHAIEPGMVIRFIRRLEQPIDQTP